jgi:histone demethylase JARID1
MLHTCQHSLDAGLSQRCELCHQKDDPESMLLCDQCDKACHFGLVDPNDLTLLCQGYHLSCLRPPLSEVPDTDWFCEACKVSDCLP